MKGFLSFKWLSALFFTFLVFGFSLHAQIRLVPASYDATADSLKNVKDSSIWKGTKYRHFTSGFSSIGFKDKGTSPLWFKGLSFNTTFAKSLVNAKLYQASGTSFNIGVASNTFNNTSSLATAFNGDFYYQLLFKNGLLSKGNVITKIGGTALTSFNFRLNPALGNNSFAFDNFTNLMFATQSVLDVSIKKERIVDLMLFKIKLSPQKRTLRLDANVGVVNLNYRPGYAYLYDSEVSNSSGDLLGFLFQDYQWSLNGIRLNSSVHYTYYLKNGNACRYTYQWDFVNAPGRFEGVQTYAHYFKFTYLFNYQ